MDPPPTPCRAHGKAQGTLWTRWQRRGIGRLGVRDERGVVFADEAVQDGVLRRDAPSLAHAFAIR
jgi:hypothetical protein